MGHIVLLAPGEHIEKQGLRLKETLKDKDNLQIHIAHMDAAVEYARGLDKKTTDVIIARGDTATLLKKSNLPFPIVDIGISDESIVQCLLQAEEESGIKNPKIGFIGMETFVERIRSFFRILRPAVTLYTAENRENIRDMVIKAKEEHMDIIIGGALVCRMAAIQNMKFILIGTNYELVAAAYERAVDIQLSLETERKKNQEIKTIFDTVADGIISVEKTGCLQTMNQKAEVILGKSSQYLRGKEISVIFGKEKAELIHEVIQTGKKITGVRIFLSEHDYAMNAVPVIVDEKIQGAVVTLSSVQDLQKAETKIRKGMYLKGNTAEYTFDDIKGNSKELKETIHLAEVFAPLQSNVLIIGQTGTGKEMFAQSIHNASDRKDGPFVAVNCGSIPDNLVESELFGYVDGAFTGAKKGGKIGYFELAHNGTIFLDEISEMSLPAQVRLLRVIQEQQVRRVGSDAVIPVNVRIIAACNQNLKQIVAEQKFRKDLYYRLSVLVLQLPELKKRRGDVGLLADYFMKDFDRKFGKNVWLSEAAKETLEELEWEGNIRQLRNFCERISAVHADGEADAEFIRRNYQSSYSFTALEESVRREEMPQQDGKTKNMDEDAATKDKRKISQEVIENLAEKYNGNKTKMALELKISRTTLWKYLKAYEKEN